MPETNCVGWYIVYTPGMPVKLALDRRQDRKQVVGAQSCMALLGTDSLHLP
jgi:hypothetical protein